MRNTDTSDLSSWSLNRRGETVTNGAPQYLIPDNLSAFPVRTNIAIILLASRQHRGWPRLGSLVFKIQTVTVQESHPMQQLRKSTLRLTSYILLQSPGS
jgi:hypothetical protein